MKTKDLTRSNICVSISGIAKIEHVDTEDIASTLVNGNGINVALTNGSRWGKIEGSKQSFSQEPADGGAYSTNIKAYFAGFTSSHEDTLHMMLSRRFVVRITDNNGQRFIAGSKEFPLRFAYTSVNDGEEAGETHYILQFFGKSRYPLFRESI